PPLRSPPPSSLPPPTPPPPPPTPTLSLHDALPISLADREPILVHDEDQVERRNLFLDQAPLVDAPRPLEQKIPSFDLIFVVDKRSEEHTSELQSRFDLVCRLLLEKKKTHRRLLHAQ